MSIVNHENWDFSERGNRDVKRHQKKIDKVIRKNVKDVISEENIITSKNGKKVKIPIKGLKDYRFKHGTDEESAKGGVGQGDGDSGDVIGRQKRKGDGSSPGKPGDQVGEDYLEAEVDIDYLIKVMFEELGLPWIDEKTKAKDLVPKGWKFETISKVGIVPRLHKKRTLMESIKRRASYAHEIVSQTGCEIEDAMRSLSQARFDLEKAVEIVKNDEVDKSIDPNRVFIEDEDIRYQQIEEDVEYHSKAVVLAMMDISGSMDRDKKYLSRSFLFWMTQFLRKVYDNVEIRFIAHTTEAKIVDEHNFFHTAESGGTMCYTAFEAANYLIDTEYPTDEWNVYCMYLSDGEDFDTDRTISEIRKTLTKNINMLGYLQLDMETYGWYVVETLKESFLKEWNFKKKVLKKTGSEFYRNDENHFLMATIKNRDDIYPALRHFLFEKK